MYQYKDYKQMRLHQQQVYRDPKEVYMKLLRLVALVQTQFSEDSDHREIRFSPM